MKRRPFPGVLLLALAGMFALSPGPARFSLEYNYPDKLSAYHHYIEGSIEGAGRADKIHLQFVRDSQMKGFSPKKLLLKEWGEKYQGSQMDLSELGLPGPSEKIERVIDKLGRVENVLKYSAGSRYYLNWLVFPDRPVSAGGIWKYSYPLNFEVFGKTLKAECQTDYALDKIMPYKKRRSAKIQLRGSCSGREGALEIQYGFEGKSFFDLDQHREIDYQLNITWVKSDAGRNLKETAKIELYSILEK
jgi:hypothetical protein